MYKILVYLKQAIQDISLDSKIPLKKILTDEDWEVIEMLCKVLKPFKSSMIVLEGENYLTLSFIQTVINSICTNLR